MNGQSAAASESAAGTIGFTTPYGIASRDTLRFLADAGIVAGTDITDPERFARTPALVRNIGAYLGTICRAFRFDAVAYTDPDMTLAHEVALEVNGSAALIGLRPNNTVPYGFELSQDEAAIVNGRRVVIVAGLTVTDEALAPMIMRLCHAHADVAGIGMVIDTTAATGIKHRDQVLNIEVQALLA